MHFDPRRFASTLIALTAATAAAAALAGTARAEAPITPPPGTTVLTASAPARFQPYDWVGGSLSAAAGGVVVGGAGLLIGYGIESAIPCHASEPEEGEWQIFDECSFHGLAGATIGAALALPPGMALGTYLYGEARGLKGGYLGALAGSYVGTAIGVGLAALVIAPTDDNEVAVGFGVGLGTVSALLGTTVGYYLSLDDDSKPVSKGPPALINLDAKRGFVGFGPPDVTFDPRPGDTRVTVTILGGTL